MTRRLWIALAGLISAGSLAAAERGFFFVQLSDPQFGMYTANKSFDQETANLEFGVATINRLKPAFVVVTGDLTNRPGDAEQIAEYHRIMRRVDPSIPVYSMPGNHDVGQEFTPESVAAYRAKYGKDYYSFRSGPVYGIVLNSSLIFAPQRAQADFEAQEKWLRKELEAARKSGAAHIIVFQHHPYFINDVNEKDAYENIPLARRKAYLDMFEQAGVRFIFTGHHHANAVKKVGAVELVITGPIGKPLRGDRSGMRLVTIKGNELTHKYYELGDLP